MHKTLRTIAVLQGCIAASLFTGEAARAATCPPNAVPDCHPCRAPACDFEGRWSCDPVPMEGHACNVPGCNNTGVCQAAVCQPSGNGAFSISKVNEQGVAIDPGATITVVAQNPACLPGGTVAAGTTNASIPVSTVSLYTVTSSVPDGYQVVAGICDPTCTWTDSNTVVYNIITPRTLDVRFQYRHYTVQRKHYYTRYSRTTGGGTQWDLFSACGAVGPVTTKVVKQAGDFPSDFPDAAFAVFGRDLARTSPGYDGTCFVTADALRGPTDCPGAPTNELGVDILVKIFSSPAYSDPALRSDIGTYPYPDACEQMNGGGQVCFSNPFPATSPAVTLPLSVTPAIPTGFGICDPIWTDCDDTCGKLDTATALSEPDVTAYCAANCNPPGPETTHWVSVFPGTLTTVAGIVGGGNWDDHVCANGFFCAPGSTCFDPEIASTDFGPQHYDRDFEYWIVPLVNGVMSGAALNETDLQLRSGGGLPAVGVEAEYRIFYPRQGTPTSPSGDLQTPHYSIAVRNMSTPGPLGVNGMKQQGPSYITPLTASDGWSVDMPTAGDQVATRGVLIWDCGHLESGPLSAGAGFHTELHPPTAMAWFHRQPGLLRNYSTLFVKAASHTPYPSTFIPFDALNPTFKLFNYNATLPLCISGPAVDYNATMLRLQTYDQTGALGSPGGEPYGTMLAGPDIFAPGTSLPKYWNISAAHLGSGNVQLSLSANFPPGGDSAITEGLVAAGVPLMMQSHFEVCQLATDANGTVTNACAGTCQAPPSGICPVGTGNVGGNCVIIARPGAPSITISGANVILSWAAVPGATSYRVYMGPGTSGSTPTLLGSPTATTWTAAGAAGNAYHFAVAAVNGTFQTALSGTTAVTLPPAAPTGVAAAGGTRQVTVSWLGSAGASTYTVYNVVGASQNPVVGTSGTSAIIGGLANQTTYSFDVQAANAAGVSPLSALVSATTCAPASCTNRCGNIPDGCGGTAVCGACALGTGNCLSGNFCGCPTGTRICDSGCFKVCP